MNKLKELQAENRFLSCVHMELGKGRRNHRVEPPLNTRLSIQPVTILASGISLTTTDGTGYFADVFIHLSGILIPSPTRGNQSDTPRSACVLDWPDFQCKMACVRRFPS